MKQNNVIYCRFTNTIRIYTFDKYIKDVKTYAKKHGLNTREYVKLRFVFLGEV